MHALPMRARNTTIGALNFFRTDEGQMGEADGSLPRRWLTWPRAAFARLRGHARNGNLKLADVAAAVRDETLAPSRLQPKRT